MYNNIRGGANYTRHDTPRSCERELAPGHSEKIGRRRIEGERKPLLAKRAPVRELRYSQQAWIARQVSPARAAGRALCMITHHIWSSLQLAIQTSGGGRAEREAFRLPRQTKTITST